ncbi:MAG: hypothetical protein EB145_13740 [Proteobacteria bacterium]|nr:hypothetical protein [Pseudomonadota bacterium]NBT94991.1 hypothetical protein [Chloroflexota bacterium]NBT19930.1 hypothetical protein [Pseudomonadota bacterium]NCV02424.1 hypothetical protein [Pseudomonadota bacterium]NCV21129.1 hypothetical protein [Chloroflexota bacterium]
MTVYLASLSRNRRVGIGPQADLGIVALFDGAYACTGASATCPGKLKIARPVAGQLRGSGDGRPAIA